jgi:hypothetical protein
MRRKGEGRKQVQIQVQSSIHRGALELLSPGKCFQVSSESPGKREGGCSIRTSTILARSIDRRRGGGDRCWGMLGRVRGSKVRTSRKRVMMNQVRLNSTHASQLRSRVVRRRHETEERVDA